MRKASKKEIEEVIHKGLVFHKARQEDDNDGKVRTKAKKKAYRTGAHGSASAIKKPTYANTGQRNPNAAGEQAQKTRKPVCTTTQMRQWKLPAAAFVI